MMNEDKRNKDDKQLAIVQEQGTIKYQNWQYAAIYGICKSVMCVTYCNLCADQVNCQCTAAGMVTVRHSKASGPVKRSKSAADVYWRLCFDVENMQIVTDRPVTDFLQ